MVAPKALAGKAVRVFGAVDQPHTFTDVRDMARALVAVAATPSRRTGGSGTPRRNPAVTQAEAVADVCRCGRAASRCGCGPGRGRCSASGGLVVPFLREMRETVHQFERPYVMDSSAIERELGLAPTPWDEVCRATAAHAGQAIEVQVPGSVSTHAGGRAAGAVEV